MRASPRLVPAARLVFVCLLATPAHAVEFEWGELSGSFDTTLTAGVSLRTESPRRSNYCTTISAANGVPIGSGEPAGGLSGDCGKSDGNLNYEAGDLTSGAISAVNELDVRWRNLGAFVRGSYFYDGVNEDGDRERTPLTRRAKNVVGMDAKLLDAYGSVDFDVLDVPMTLRVGKQVISWGESTFIQNGINVLSPVDVGRLRVPGAELREALEPIPAVWAWAGVTENLSLEGFYQFAWSKTVIDPPGSFFSNSDGLGRGGEFLDISLGHNDCATNPIFFGLRQDGTIGAGCVRRGPDDDPSDQGEFGFAARLFVPELNSAEFGLYYLRYHSRLPYISGSFQETFVQAGVRLFGLGFDPIGNPAQAAAAAGAVISGVRANQQYPADIDKLGFSASFTVERLYNIAVQGEVAYTFGQPIQLSEAQLLRGLFEGAGVPGSIPTLPGVTPPPPGQFFSGAIDKDMITHQITVTKVAEPGPIVRGVFGADQFIFVGEFGLMAFPGLESESRITYQGAVTPQAIDEGNTATQNTSFASDFSAGYVLRMALVYNNALLGINLQPVVGFSHDVAGTSPAPLGNFVKNRQAINLALRGDYLNAWSGEIAYTNFFGGGLDNPRRDRDFVSATISYSF